MGARRAAAARASAAVRDHATTREDILQRYRGAAASAEAEGRTRSVTGEAGTRAGVGSDEAARIAEARRTAAARGASPDATRDAAEPGRRDATGADGGDAQRARIPTRERDEAAIAARVASARKDYAASIAARNSGAGRGGIVDSIIRGRDAGAGAPVTTDRYHGRPIARGVRHNGYVHHGWSYDYGHCHWNYWGAYCGSPWSWWLFGPFYSCGYWWNSYWYCGGYWSPYYHPRYYWYGPFLPYSVSVVVNTEPEVVYVDSTPAVDVAPVDAAPVGEATVPAPAAPLAPVDDGTLNRAADYYLSLGDRAFREGRYGDAVHYYAKAIEFSPDDGILHLVLADALFATGDYRYAAYALRTAFEKDSALAANVVDKRSFYANPADFDAQLALLERYLEDHFLDDDARLVLAANYLFGGRPHDAVRLLESPFSEALRGTPPGRLMLDVSRELTSRPAVR